MSRTSIESLKLQCLYLAGIAAAGRQLETGFESNNMDEVLMAVRRTRIVRAASERVPICWNEIALGHPETANVLGRFETLTAQSQFTIQMVQQWLGRKIPDDAVLLQTPLGLRVLADAMLPEVWDLQSDLVVLVGGQMEELADVLRGGGQSRVVIFDPERDKTIGADRRVLGSLDSVSDHLRTMTCSPPMRMTVRISPTKPVPKERIDELVARTVATLRDVRSRRDTLVNFSAQWTSQSITNLPAVSQTATIDSIGAEFSGKPLVIVAPGPSLAKNIEALGAARDKVLIMALSHSLAPLTQANIVPDFVLTTESQDTRYHFETTDMSTVGAMLNITAVHPGLYSMAAPRVLTLSANSGVDRGIFEVLGENTYAGGGGSVATVALSVGQHWQCEPIIMVGLDLSYSDNAMYVDTCVDGALQVQVSPEGKVVLTNGSEGWKHLRSVVPQSECVSTLPGYYGGTVTTSQGFVFFHQWFEQQAAAVCGESKIYNCTEGGAFIRGMLHRPLTEVLSSLDAVVSTDAAFAKIDGSPHSAARSQRILAWITAQRDTVQKSHELAQRGLTLLAMHGTGPEVSEVARKLQQEIESAEFMIHNTIVARENFRALRCTALTPQEELLGYTTFLQSVLDVAQSLLPTIDVAIAQMGPIRGKP